MIQGVHSFTTFKTSVSFHFLHLSVQELLGAYHISKLPATNQIEIFNDLFDQPRLAAVFRFYAAFTKLQTKGIRDIVARIVQTPLLVNLLHGLYEAQDLSLCKFVASHLNGELDLHGNTLSPMDCLVVGYFLFCLTPTKEFKVGLSNCSLDEYRLSFLVRELSKCSSSLLSLQTLNLRNNNISDGGAVHVSEILRHSYGLKTLDISNCGIGDQGIKSLASALELSTSLKTLNISRCGIGDQGMKSLANTLEMISSLEELDLSKNPAFTGVGLMALGESLKRNRGLKSLGISHCRIDGQSMKSLASVVEISSSLKTLDVSSCGIDDQGIKSLASALEINSSLEELYLNGNIAVTGVGLMGLGESLKGNRRLNTLWLRELWKISDKAWKQFIVCLQENDYLKELVLPFSYTLELVQVEAKIVNWNRRQRNLLPLDLVVSSK